MRIVPNQTIRRGAWIALVLLAAVLFSPRSSWAIVTGTTPSKYKEFRVFGRGIGIGNTLMSPTASNPLVNQLLLTENSASLSNIPSDAVIKGAYLFWSASQADSGIDTTFDITLTDGFKASNQLRDQCFSVNGGAQLGVYFYCRKDITSLVAQHPGSNSWNGVYTVGGITAKPGQIDPDDPSRCAQTDPGCQGRYAGWSMIVVYDTPVSESTQRDVIVYDGFMLLDERADSLGVWDFQISDFLVANPPKGTLTYFALEGDALLGVPPQNNDPQFPCATCYDFISFNGTKLQDEKFQPNNIFNSSTGVGVDIDTIDISSLLAPNMSSAQIRVGSGDGILDGQPAVHGHGELILYGYTLLTIDRLAPNFRKQLTSYLAVPNKAAAGEIVTFELTLSNEGSIASENVTVKLDEYTPTGCTYVANSTKLDGKDTSGDGAVSPLKNGLNIGGIPIFPQDFNRTITWRCRIDNNVAVSKITSQATVTYRYVNGQFTDSVKTPIAEVQIIDAKLGTPTMTVSKPQAPFNEFRPGDTFLYTVKIKDDSGTGVSNAEFTLDMPKEAKLLFVISNFDNSGSNPAGGANGTGQIVVKNISAPPGGEATITVTAQILTSADLSSKGITPINGHVVSAQGDAKLGATTKKTDDPAKPGASDATTFSLSSGIAITASKVAVDKNGGNLIPGDSITYTITVKNTGSLPATVTLSDDMPPLVGPAQNLQITGTGTQSYQAPPAGANQTGRLTVSNWIVPGGGTVTATFDLPVLNTAKHGDSFENSASIAVTEDPTQNRNVTSNKLTINYKADLSTSKKEVSDVNGGEWEANDEALYTVTITNNGSKDDSNVVVTDTVDANLASVVVEDGGSFNSNTRVITWNVGALKAGESKAVKFRAKLPATLPGQITIKNSALIKSTEVPAGLTVTRDITVVPRPRFNMTTKTVADQNGGAFEPGDTVTYTITVKNNGSGPGSNVVVTDAIDSNLTDVNASASGGVFQNGTITWNLGALAQGASKVLTFTAKLKAVIAVGTSISNQAKIVATELPNGDLSDDPGDGVVGDGDPTVFAVKSEATLSTSDKKVEDLNGGVVQPGDQLRFTITVKNTGNAPAQNVVVTDVVDPALLNVAAQNNGVFDSNTRTVTWTLATPVNPGDALPLSFTGTVNPQFAGSQFTNQGVIRSSTFPTPVNTNVVTVKVETRPDFATSVKQINSDGPEPAPGKAVTFLIKVKNTGTKDATGVVVRDPNINVNLTNVSVVGGSFDSNSRTATWNVGNLKAGAETTLQLTATIVIPLADQTQICNQAFIKSTEVPTEVGTITPDTVLPPPPSGQETCIRVSSKPKITFSKTYIDQNGLPVKPADTVTFTLALQNDGTALANNLVVSDKLDQRLSFVSATDGGIFDANTRTITWSHAQVAKLKSLDLGSANKISVSFVVKVASPLDNGTEIPNQAELVGDAPLEKTLSDDPATTEPPTAQPDATILKIVSGADFTQSTKTVSDDNGPPFRPGDEVTYTLTIKNTGDANGVDVVVSDPIPAQLENVVPGQNGSVQNGTVVWNKGAVSGLAALAPGQSVNLTFKATIKKPLTDKTVVANQGEITAQGVVAPFKTDADISTPTPEKTLFEVTATPNFSTSTKTVEDSNGGDIEPGDELVYSITLKNTGDAEAENLVVKDVIDTQKLTNIQVTGAVPGTFDGQSISWTVPKVALSPAGDVTLKFKATVLATLPNQTKIRNEATIPGVTPAPFVEVTVVSLPKFEESTKALTDQNGGFLEPGDAVTYTITVKNSGKVLGSNVVVEDDLPAALENVVPQNGGVLNGNAITWTVGNLDPGKSVQVSFTARIKATTPHNTIITNTARINATELNQPTVIKIESTVISGPIFSESQKSVTDINGAPTLPGDALTFTLTIKNTGNQPGQNVVVEDTIDPTTLTNIVPNNGGVLSGNTIRWTLGTLAAGQSQTLSFAATVNPSIEAGKKIENVALVKSDKVPDGQQTNKVTLDVTKPDVTVVKVATTKKAGFAAANEVVIFTITVENTGAAPVTNAVVTDAVDLNSFQEVKPIDGVVDGNGVITWQGGVLANIPPRTKVGVVFSAKVKSSVKHGSTISNTAKFKSTGVPEFSSNQVNLQVEVLPDFQRTEKRVLDLNGGNVEPGDKLRYTITVRNDGPGEATNVVVVDRLNTVLEQMEADQGGQINGTTIRWTGSSTPALAKIPAGGEVQLSWVGVVPPTSQPGSKLTDQAFVTSKEVTTEVPSDDPTTSVVDDPTSVTVTQGHPFNFTQKSFSDPNGGLHQPGDEIEFSIRVVHFQSLSIGGVTVTDAIPPFMTYIAGSTRVGGTLVPDLGGQSALSSGLDLGTIAPGNGAAKVVTFRARINADAKSGSVIKNQATIAASGFNPFQTNTVEFVVGSGPNLSRTLKTALVDDKNGNKINDVGESITYTIVVENAGNQDATNVVFKDPLPKNTTYLAGSLIFDGKSLTDGKDTDAGSVDNGTLSVTIGTLAPGKSATIQFRVTIDAGPTVSNQGIVSSDQTRDEPTDSDGDESNGNQPTVTPVGSDVVSLTVTKKVRDLNGDVVKNGDALMYEITLKNDGNIDAKGVSLSDTLPTEVGFAGQSSTILPAGATLTVGPGAGGGGSLTIANITVPANKSVTVSLRVTLRNDVAKGTKVCNSATATVGTDKVDSKEPACFVVGSAAGTGGLSGVVFQDKGEKNKIFDEGDLPLTALQIMIHPGGEAIDKNKPVASAITDQQGKFSFPNLETGKYTLRVLTSTGVFLAKREVVVKVGEVENLSIAIDPSGRLYNAKTGALITGVTVSMIYDAEDAIAPGQLVPATAYVDPSQQNQVTDINGLYKFDLVETGRRYQLVVTSTSFRLNFPSQLIPPTPGFAKVDAQNNVVPNGLPDITPKVDKTYYLRFRIDAKSDEVFNNHIPLDPIEALIQLDKRANKTKVRVGDIVSYTIKVQNRSKNDLLYNATTGTGGVYIQDLLPDSFKLVKNQVTMLLEKETRQRIEVFSPETPKLMLFGKRDGGKRIPVDLPAGATLTLVYQVVVGANVKINREYENRAVVVNDGNVVISNEDRAKVLVVPDPIFDQGSLIGKVFCDKNKNGWQDQKLGETGVEGVRIYLDSGYYAVTDNEGKFHFYDIDPGTHMVKLDQNTLPPGSGLTTQESRVLYFTRGLMQKVNFGVDCKHTIVGPQEVILSDKSLAPKFENYVTLRGQLGGFRFTVDGKARRGFYVDAKLAHADAAPNFKFVDGRLQGELITFLMALKMDTAVMQKRSLHWRLQVYEADKQLNARELVREFFGRGGPPLKLAWNGKTSAFDRLVLKSGHSYLYRLVVSDGLGNVASSPWRAFGVNYGLIRGAIFSKTLRAKRPFRGDRPTPELQRLLTPLVKKVKSSPGATLEIKIHSASEGSETAKLRSTQRQAKALQRWIIKRFKLSASDVRVVGLGLKEPLYPSFGQRNILLNRRVEVRGLLGKVGDLKDVKLVSPKPAARLLVNGEPQKHTSSGFFTHTVARPKTGLIILDMTDRQGHRWVGKLRVSKARSKPKKPIKVAFFLDILDRKLSVSQREIPLTLLNVRAKTKAVAELAPSGKLQTPLTFTFDQPLRSVRRWYFNVYSSDGALVYTVSQSGTPPETYSWSGVDSGNLPLSPGNYRYRFVVESPEGHAGMSPERRLTVKQGKVKRQRRRGKRPRRRKRRGTKKRQAPRGFRTLTVGGDATKGLSGRLKTALNRVATLAKGQTTLKLRVEVHSGGLSSETAQRRKTQQAAQRIRRYLISRGVPASRISAVGRGNSDPLVPNFGARNVAKNFRVVIKGRGGTPQTDTTPKIETEPLDTETPDSVNALRIDGETQSIDHSGKKSFARMLVPGSDVVFDITSSSGGRAIYVIRIEEPGLKAPTPTRKAPRKGAPKKPRKPLPKKRVAFFTTQLPGFDAILGPNKGGVKFPLRQNEVIPSGGDDVPRFGLQIVAQNFDIPLPPGYEKKKKRTRKPKKPVKKPAPKVVKKPAPLRKRTPATVKTPAPTPKTPTKKTGSPKVERPLDPKPLPTPAPTPLLTPAPKPLTTVKKAPVVPFGRMALFKSLKTSSKDVDYKGIQAAQLQVYLPPREIGGQAVTIKAGTLTVRGTTHRTNKITVNGKKVLVKKDGRFSTVVKVPWGRSKVTIVATDTKGNRARIEWPIRRAKFSWFLLAVAEAATGQIGANLEGFNSHTGGNIGPMFIHGKAKVYFKAQIKGSKLFKEYFITAHVDSSKRSQFEEFFRQTIDPEKYYPVFGDSSTLVKDVNARGKVYVLVKADDSTLTVGNFHTKIKGIELLDYNRPFYGVKVDFNKTFAKNYQTQVKSFVSWEDRNHKRSHNTFRGTGGSIYYLRHTELLEGSEQIKLVVRDRDNGMVLMEIPKSRDSDYTINYRDGRIYFKNPVPSVVDAGFISSGFFGSRTSIDGHAVYIDVSYEYQGRENEGDVSWGTHVKQTFFKMITVGGGYVQEGRKNGTSPNYRLYGAELKFNWKKKTWITAEFAGSESQNSANLISDDGGLTFKNASLTEDVVTKGYAFKIAGQTEIGELIGKKKDWLLIKAHYSRQWPGFYSGGSVLEQGTEKYGGEVKWHVTARDLLTLRHDGVVALTPDTEFVGNFRSLEKEISTLQYIHKRKKWQVVAEYSHLYTEDSRDPKGIHGDSLALSFTYSPLKWLDVTLQQEGIIHGDSRLLQKWGDHLRTTVGVGFKVTKDLKFTLAEELKWSGENTTIIGMKTKINERSDFYVEERLKSTRDSQNWYTTTVIGAQEKFGKNKRNRTYGEYQLDTGVSGLVNRAVLGFDRLWPIIRGINVRTNYERSQTFGGIVGNTSRDAVSISLELLRWEWFKLGSKFELRYDNNNEDAGGQDKIQYTTLNTVTVKPHSDVTLFARFNYSQTGNLHLDIREAELMEATIGLAYRPVKHDWVNIIAKYTHLVEMRPLNLVENSLERTVQDVAAVEVIFELPFHLQIYEKFAWKQMQERIDALDPVSSHTILWINRVSYHLFRPKKIFGGVDASLEYRQLHQFLSNEFKHGVLVEVSVLLTKFAKIGVGYNFTSFSDNEFSKYDKNEGGFFVRVIGRF